MLQMLFMLKHYTLTKVRKKACHCHSFDHDCSSRGPLRVLVH